MMLLQFNDKYLHLTNIINVIIERSELFQVLTLKPLIPGLPLNPSKPALP